MPELLLIYLVAAATVSWMVCLAFHNRRTGWRRPERANWLPRIQEMREQLRWLEAEGAVIVVPFQAPPPGGLEFQPADPPAVANSILGLHQALGASQGEPIREELSAPANLPADVHEASRE